MENFFAFFEHFTNFDIIVILSIFIPILLTAKYNRQTKEGYKLTLKDKIIYCSSILLFFILVLINALLKME